MGPATETVALSQVVAPLPIGLVFVVGALIYLVALIAAIEDDTPIR